MTTTPKPRRRWFQYSLRTLFVLALLACIGMGWVAVEMQRVRKEREAVEAIERLGGMVLWSSAEIPQESRGRACLRKLLGDDYFVHPNMVVISDDAAMEYLTELTQLEYVGLHGTQITDAGLAHLKGLTRLSELYIEDHTQVTDAGLRHLEGLTQLQQLYLVNTQVSASAAGELWQALPSCGISR